MYGFVVILGVLALTKAQGFSLDTKVEGLGETSDALTVLKKDLEDLIKSITTLEDEIEVLKARSCASISTFQSQMQTSSSSAAQSTVDLSGYVLKSQLSKQVEKVDILAKQYGAVMTASEAQAEMGTYSKTLDTLIATYISQDDDYVKLLKEIEAAAETNIKCSEGWTKYNNHCYAFFRDMMSWEDAMGSCVGHGAYLLEVNSWDELSWLKRFLYSDQYSNVWVGGTDVIEEGVWRWAGSGELLLKSLSNNWDETQPDNWEQAEHAMELTYINRYFNDQKASSWKNFVCEQWLD